MSRPRRSRQVRGVRARSYVRTLARVSTSELTDAELSVEQTRVKNEAEATGALASMRRLHAKRFKATRAQ